MNKSLLMAAAAAIALAPAADAGPVLYGTSPAAKKPAGANRALEVLYDQNGTDFHDGIVSQNFQSSFDKYDNQAADDFIVPKGAGWSLHEVDVVGQYFHGEGPAESVNVILYYHAKAKGEARRKPGEVRASFAGLAPSKDNNGAFALRLPGAVRLRPGHYWLSVQVNMNSHTAGEWGWESQTAVVGWPAQWRNPNDGFDLCPEWQQESVCVPIGQGDHMFTLRGRARG
jgi:hypothetical protein